MKNVRLGLVLFACVPFVSPAVRAAETFTVDASHTAVIFSVSHFGYSFTYGRFNKTAGRFLLDQDDPSNSQFQFELDVASIDTNDAKRDDHLRGADFFHATRFPQITFQSTSVIKTENGYDVTGNLTLRGIVKQVTLPMKVMGEGKGPYGKYRYGIGFQLQIKRSDFGMKNMIGPIGDNVAVTASFEGVRDEPR